MVERKYYDLTPSQKLMYFALKFIPEKNVVNIGTAVWFHENIDCELLKALFPFYRLSVKAQKPFAPLPLKAAEAACRHRLCNQPYSGF